MGILLCLLFNYQSLPGPNASAGAAKSVTHAGARQKGPVRLAMCLSPRPVVTSSLRWALGVQVPWCTLQGKNKCHDFFVLKSSIKRAGSTGIVLAPCFVHGARLLARPQTARCIGQEQAGDCALKLVESGFYPGFRCSSSHRTCLEHENLWGVRGGRPQWQWFSDAGCCHTALSGTCAANG